MASPLRESRCVFYCLIPKKEAVIGVKAQSYEIEENKTGSLKGKPVRLNKVERKRYGLWN